MCDAGRRRRTRCTRMRGDGLEQKILTNGHCFFPFVSFFHSRSHQVSESAPGWKLLHTGELRKFRVFSFTWNFFVSQVSSCFFTLFLLPYQNPRVLFLYRWTKLTKYNFQPIATGQCCFVFIELRNWRLQGFGAQLLCLFFGLFWRGPLILPLVVYAFGSLLQFFSFLE